MKHTVYYKKSSTVRQFRRLDVDNSITSKEKRIIALLKLNVNHWTFQRYSGLGKVWGEKENQFVIHDFMSLNTYNKSFSYFLSKLKSSKLDPFQEKLVLLDNFCKYYLFQMICNMEMCLKRKILRQFKNIEFSNVTLID